MPGFRGSPQGMVMDRDGGQRYTAARHQRGARPITWSISHGIGYGFLTYVVIQVLTGQ